MADYLEAVLTLWSAPSTIAVVGAVVAAEVAVTLFGTPNRFPAESGRTRVLVLVPVLASFLWVFLGVSLTLCLAEAYGGRYSLADVIRISGIGLAAATAAAIVLALLVWALAARRVLRRVGARAADEPERAAVRRAWAAIARGAPPPVHFVDQSGGVCFAVGGRRPAIVISSALFSELDERERASVLAHEWGHIRNGDAFVKALSGTLSRVLFFDPLLRFLDPAIHRSREYAADAESARAGLGIDLAAALLKIAGRSYPAPTPSGGIVGPEEGWRARYPPLRKRVRRLLGAADAGPDVAP